MGSYITTGLVFSGSDVDVIKSKLKVLIMYLAGGSGCYKFVKASKDADGNDWVELKFEELNDIQEGYRFASEGYFGQIDLTTRLFKSDEISASIRVEKESDYFGLLVDIAEDDLLKSNESEVLNAADELMTKVMCELHNVLKYDYAFCDNEAELQFSPNEFQSLNEDVYSITVMTSNSELENIANVFKSHWYLNGLTSREAKVTSVHGG
jgi:hypothetical protein